MYNQDKRKSLSQNFVKNPALIRYILGLIGMPQKSLVLDIGVGEGIISQELLKLNYRVIGIEKDIELIKIVRNKLPSLEVVDQDFLKYNFPLEDFWIVSNPPFSIFSQIIKKIIYEPNQNQGFLIFGQDEAIQRIMGEGGDSILSVILKSFYQVEIVHKFNKSDFSPQPNIEVSLLKGVKMPTKLLESQLDYIKFVQFGFSQQKSNLGNNLKNIFTYNQWKRLSQTYKFNIKADPADITVNQWKSLYNFYQNNVIEEKKIKVI